MKNSVKKFISNTVLVSTAAFCLYGCLTNDVVYATSRNGNNTLPATAAGGTQTNNNARQQGWYLPDNLKNLETSYETNVQMSLENRLTLRNDMFAILNQMSSKEQILAAMQITNMRASSIPGMVVGLERSDLFPGNISDNISTILKNVILNPGFTSPDPRELVRYLLENASSPNTTYTTIKTTPPGLNDQSILALLAIPENSDMSPRLFYI